MITVVIYYWYSLEITTYSSSGSAHQNENQKNKVESKFWASNGNKVPVQSQNTDEKVLGCSVEILGNDCLARWSDANWMDDAWRTNFSLKLHFLNENKVTGKDKFVNTQTAADKQDVTYKFSWYQTSSNSFLYIIAGVLFFDMFAGMSATCLGPGKYSSLQSVTGYQQNKTINQQTVSFQTDVRETTRSGGQRINDAPGFSTVNKLWFAVPKVSYSRKRRRPHFAAFLAYCHNDSDFVFNKLYEPLQKYLHNSFPSWSQEFLTLLYDKHFLPGQPLDEICRAAVYDSHVTVAIVSDSFIQSPWCLYEMENAVVANVPVIPLYLTHRDITCFSGIMKHVYDQHVRTFWPRSVKKSGQMTEQELDVVQNIGYSVATYIKQSTMEGSELITNLNYDTVSNESISLTKGNYKVNDSNYDTISNFSISVYEGNDLTNTMYDMISDHINSNDEEENVRKNETNKSNERKAPKQCCEWFAMLGF